MASGLRMLTDAGVSLRGSASRVAVMTNSPSSCTADTASGVWGAAWTLKTAAPREAIWKENFLKFMIF